MAYDVFISFKNTAPGGGLTVDRTIAERLHMKLRDEGLEVFFSEKDLSTTAFMDEIYQALDEADLLILIGSSIEYINSEWVKSEWSTFFGAMKSGRKPKGEIMTVLQGMTTLQLPIQLGSYESFRSDDLDSAVTFAFRSLGKVKRSEAAARLAEEQERKRREAEESALREMQRRMEAELAVEKERLRAEEERISLAARLRMEDEYAERLRKEEEVKSSADTGKAPATGGQKKIFVGHTHDYEYTRQEADATEVAAAKELRTRVSEEMQMPIEYKNEKWAEDDSRVQYTQPSPEPQKRPDSVNSYKRVVYRNEDHRRVNDEIEEAAEREVRQRIVKEIDS